ncbi:cathepsin O [Lepisosteus oculatus]|uniref:cathepsin O n=1 Tax=Lepisosteus oculatus TaxID=7918 RepID=UPI0035F51CC8
MRGYILLVLVAANGLCALSGKIISDFHSDSYRTVHNVLSVSGHGGLVKSETSEFRLFREKFNRRFVADSKDFLLKLDNFKASIRRHSFLNLSFDSSNNSAQYGINQFSDFSTTEFREQYLKARPEKVPLFTNLKEERFHGPLPLRFDWRDKKVVTPVQNQQSCGGCWAFSVVGGIESVYGIQGHSLEELSVQQVIDCSYKNKGCNGGSTVVALNWLNQTKEKLVKELDYPFKALTGICHYFAKSHFGVSIKDFVAYDFSGQEEVMMEKLVNWGPLAVTVDAVSWQDYLGGVIQHHCSSQEANHAVLITGYDRTGDVPYWIVRNSWGASWGNEGYVYIKMGSNVCGIADTVTAAFL